MNPQNINDYFMKAPIYFSIILLVMSCNNSVDMTKGSQQSDTVISINDPSVTDTTIGIETPVSKLSIIVLPPYDENANEGISPDIQNFLEDILLEDTSLNLIRFPYKQLMNVPYYNIFDKKFCRPIIDKVKADVLIMSQVEQATRTGEMSADKWNFQIRIYNAKTEKQMNSTVSGNNLTANNIKAVLKDRQASLTKEIKDNR